MCGDYMLERPGQSPTQPNGRGSAFALLETVWNFDTRSLLPSAWLCGAGRTMSGVYGEADRWQHSCLVVDFLSTLEAKAPAHAARIKLLFRETMLFDIRQSLWINAQGCP